MNVEIQTIVGHEPHREGEYPTYFNVGHDGVTRIERVVIYNCYNGDQYDIYKGEHLHATMMEAGVAVIYYKDQTA